MATQEDQIALLRFLPQGTDQWKELTKGSKRIFDVTASIAPNIVGVSSYTSPYKQWLYDCGMASPPENEYTATLLQRGTEDEDSIVDLFLQWYNNVFADSQLISYKVGTWQHPRYSWLAASPDRLLYDVKNDQVYLLEAKSRQEDRDATEPSDAHYVQCQLQLACIPEARGLWYVSANIRSELVDVPMMIYAVTRNDTFINKEVIPRLEEHRRRVANKIAPPQRQTRKPHFLEYRTATVKQAYPDVC